MSVYFAQVGPYVKIGYSADPVHRMTTVTRNGERPSDIPYGADVDLIGWIPGDRWREAQIHSHFIADRVAGEWFYLDREAAHQAIRDDPRGVDLHRMGGQVSLLMWKHPELTRDELEAAGEIVWADPDTTRAVLKALTSRPRVEAVSA